MTVIAWLTATGLTIKFVYTFLYIFFNRKSLRNGSQYPGMHRVPDSKRAKRNAVVDVSEIITTGDIYSSVTDKLDDGFTETLTSDGALLNNEGWKTYPA